MCGESRGFLWNDWSRCLPPGERPIDGGELAGYAEDAQEIGVTRARLKQVMNMVLLAPAIQGAILLAEVQTSERSLRRAVQEPVWKLRASQRKIEDNN